MKRLLHLILIQLSCFQILRAQDIHWSQYNHNPIYYNPAQAGNFENDLRFTANYRDQWRSVTKPFNTIAFAADTRLKKVKDIGVAGNFLHDVAGDGLYRTLQLMGSVAHKLTLTQKTIVRLGAQLGINHRSIDYSKLTFDSQFVDVSYSEANPNNENFGSGKKTSLLTSIGGLLLTKLNRKMDLEFGIGFFNLNRPNQSINAGIQKRDIRTTIQTKAIYKINSDLYLLPSIQFNTQGKYKSFLLGSDIRYELLKRNGQYRALFAGFWTRVKDATWFTIGAQYQQTFVGLSYDINYSKLVPASRVRGGLEISIRHEISYFRPKQQNHRVCPDYI